MFRSGNAGTLGRRDARIHTLQTVSNCSSTTDLIAHADSRSLEGVAEQFATDVGATTSDGSKECKGTARNIESERKISRYFLVYLPRTVWRPLALAALSNALAVQVVEHAERNGGEFAAGLYRSIDTLQNVIIRAYFASFLSFLLGFYLNNAFQRNAKSLELVQKISSQLRAGVDLCLAAIARGPALQDPEQSRQAHEVVVWAKMYFIKACLALNSLSLLGMRRNIVPMQQRWDGLLASQVQLCERTRATVRAHNNMFVSTLQMELLWWRWLTPVLERVASSNKADRPADLGEARKCFEVARSSFNSAHLIANGMQSSPVMVWLLGGVMHFFCLSLPWLLVRGFGLASFAITLFTTGIFFGARQIGADMWEPFGIDHPGVVDIELFDRARALCDQLDNMWRLFTMGYYAPLEEGGASALFV